MTNVNLHMVRQDPLAAIQPLVPETSISTGKVPCCKGHRYP